MKLKLVETLNMTDYTLQKNNQDVGSATIIKLNNLNYVTFLGIEPEFRGEGYSNELVKDLVDKYDANVLEVETNNTAAIKAYEKNGFKIVDKFYDDEFSVYLMTRGNISVNYNDLITIHKELDSNVTDDELRHWYRINEDVSLDKDGNFVSDIDANFKMGENYHLYDFDFKEVTPKMYKAIEEQSFANTNEFKDEYVVSWWDSDKLVAIVSEFDDAYGKRWLSYIEVTKQYRGHNLSTELLDYAVNGLGCTMLGVAKSNKVAIKVYQDYGFKIIGDNPNNSKQYWMQTISSLQKESDKLKEDYSKDTKISLKIDNQKVGKAMIRDYQDEEIFLTDFEILPEFRGKGYGKKSFDMLVNKYGVNSLSVNPENSVALNMYKKFGFNQVGEPYWDDNSKETVIYMKKDLKESLLEDTRKPEFKKQWKKALIDYEYHTELNEAVDTRFNDNNELYTDILKIITAVSKKTNLFSGDCGQFALAFCDMLRKKDIPVELIFCVNANTLPDNFADLSVPDMFNDLIAGEPDLYHVAFRVNQDKMFDGSGEIDIDYLVNFCIEEYRDDDPILMAYSIDDQNDFSTLTKIIRWNTAWNKETEYFTKLISQAKKNTLLETII